MFQFSLLISGTNDWIPEVFGTKSGTSLLHYGKSFSKKPDARFFSPCYTRSCTRPRLLTRGLFNVGILMKNHILFCLQYLLQSELDVAAPTKDGQTALHRAVQAPPLPIFGAFPLLCNGEAVMCANSCVSVLMANAQGSLAKVVELRLRSHPQ